jgi:hypothetical protein
MTTLVTTMAELSRRARALGMTDIQWANRAGIRNETLSRLRRRPSCDYETLRLLAEAVGASLTVSPLCGPERTPDGHFPSQLDRDYEERLLDLSLSSDVEPERWLTMGPRFFMAGFAVMLASVAGLDRRRLLELAEHLHPGISEVNVFNRWLKRSPLRPTRFLSLLDTGRTIRAA